MGGMTHNYIKDTDSCISEIKYLLESYVSDKERVEHFSRSRATYFRYKRKFFAEYCQPSKSVATYYRTKKRDSVAYNDEWGREVADRQREYRIYHRKEEEARALVGEALRKGILIKPTMCEICGAEKKLNGHHTDYDRPLYVIWCCKSCHWKQHHSKIS